MENKELFRSVRASTDDLWRPWFRIVLKPEIPSHLLHWFKNHNNEIFFMVVLGHMIHRSFEMTNVIKLEVRGVGSFNRLQFFQFLINDVDHILRHWSMERETFFSSCSILHYFECLPQNDVSALSFVLRCIGNDDQLTLCILKDLDSFTTGLGGDINVVDGEDLHRTRSKRIKLETHTTSRRNQFWWWNSFTCIPTTKSVSPNNPSPLMDEILTGSAGVAFLIPIPHLESLDSLLTIATTGAMMKQVNSSKVLTFLFLCQNIFFHFCDVEKMTLWRSFLNRVQVFGRISFSESKMSTLLFTIWKIPLDCPITSFCISPLAYVSNSGFWEEFYIK